MAWDTWFLEDNQVKTWIVNSVSSDIQPLILRKKTARDMWIILEQMYGQKKRKVHIREVRAYLSQIDASQADTSNEVKFLWVQNTSTCTPWEAYSRETTPVVAHNSMDSFTRCSGRALIHGCVNSKERYSAFPKDT
ncbi:hypothetical protein EJ110_NYTH37178 [Nymphaea thermarum]|nr:hypothetical protein EJ110_NYTH37178 [Nymphaea thermarum]